ncbi:MAG TPA: (Fe-S)-binding protein, partial [Marmoricola sp.]|nr:(Fe-S)-binding protein [Marmoricola sp.]
SVDMATYKAEFLAHHYEGRLRPRADYATGWLPLAARLVHRLGLAGVVNAASHAPFLHWLGLKAAGLETGREVPLFAGETLQQWFARTRDRTGPDPSRPLAGSAPRPGGGTSRGRVLLWPDTFTNHFHPEIGIAAIQVMERAGWEVTMPSEPLCCGLTWISTGQLGTARKMVREAVAAVAPHVRDGGLVVGLEPSCTTVFRADAPELFPDDRDVLRLRDATVTFAELLMEHTPGWEPPHVDDAARGADQPRAVAQVHCHQHAVLGWEADQKLLDAVGIEAEQLASGCCGLAGNFGFTEGHGEVSEACAEQVLLPRLREEPAETIVLADGFSCRTQIHDLDSGGHEGRHLAEVIDAAESGGHVDGRTPLARTSEPGLLPRLGALAAAATPLAAAAALGVLTRKRHRAHN